ncbi:hypothetical protein ACIQLJ_00640 [Microbacterium sp. NPDC091313]
MTRRPLTTALLAAGLLAAAAGLAACAPEPGAPTPSPLAGGTATPGETASAAPTATPTPSATPVSLPTDCRAILSEQVLAQLADVPLNDPATGVATGVQPDGSLVCLWRDPGADTTALTTEISRMNRGPALDMLNTLKDDQGFSCYTPSGGTRCEKTWPDASYPVTNGRTVFWRDDVLIDTRWSNLAPTGYTDSIVDHLFG